MNKQSPPRTGKAGKSKQPAASAAKATRKTTASKRASTSKTTVSKRASASKTASSKRASASARAGKAPQVDRDARRAMVAQAAYFRAEKRGFGRGGELDDWLEAEREVSRVLDE